ncbi:MAG: S41 family peptidase [Clostridia bacterium]|nr:S41 family peptidase [Clostridia bacterium]
MKNGRTKVWVISLILIGFIGSFFLGYFFSVVRLVSWDVFTSKPLNDWFKPQLALFFDEDQVDMKTVRAFNRVKNILGTRYYEPVNFSNSLSMAIKGLAAGTKDPYTVYYTPDEMKQFLEDTSGNYVGIGISVHMDENSLLTVADVFPDSPAKAAGIIKDDKIVKVNNEDVTPIKDADLIIKKIKGAPGTKVHVTVFRPSIKDYKEFDLERKPINVSYISSEMLDNKIGYIRIKQFDEDIDKDFEVQLNGLLAQGAKGLIIDVRDNPGGDYNEVVKICDRLVPKGLIVYTEDRNKNREEEYSDARELNMPLSVLVNGYSASASEILAACIKDYGKGTLVGTKTFGKGLVQSIDNRFSNGGGLKYTIARYFTPSGKCIHGIGVMPDIEIQLNDQFKTTAIEDIPHDKDNQLKIAIQEVIKKMK